MARAINASTDRVYYAGLVMNLVSVFAMRFRTTAVTGNSHLASHCSSASRNGWLMLQNSNKLHIIAYGASAQRLNLVSLTNINDNAWHSAVLCMQRTSGGANSLYVDGNLEASGNSSGDWQTGSAYFPCAGDSFDAFWSTAGGAVADLAMWNAIHLTPAEVMAYHQGCSPLRIRRSALTVYSSLIRDTRSLTGISSNFEGGAVARHPRLFGGPI